MKSKRFEGKRALITGASSGIGFELSRIMAADGFDLVLTARREDRLSELKETLESAYGTTVTILPLDLADRDSVRKLADELKTRELDVDVLVNNAGFGVSGPFVESDWERESQMMDVNMHALADLTKRLLPPMVTREFGRIMNVASTAAFQPGPGMAVYFATKSFVLHFSEALAHELRGTGVTLTALCPGATRSEFLEMADLEGARMVTGRKLPTAAAVARFGYRAMMKGKRVAIHGRLNRLMAFSLRLTPRRMVTAITGWIMSSGDR